MMDFWPSNFFVSSYKYLKTGKEKPVSTSLRDHPLRQEYMGNVADLVRLSVTCRRISVIAREALYSRVRVDNRKALLRLTSSLSRQTSTTNLNARFIQRLELDMDLEDERRVFGFTQYNEFGTFTPNDLAPYPGCRLGSLFTERVFSICPSLKSLAALYQRRLAWNDEKEVESARLGPAKVLFFILLCYLPALRTLVLRFPESHPFLKDRGGGPPPRLPYYRSLFDLVSETIEANRSTGGTPQTAPAGTWPCPSLEELKVYGQPFPYDCGRSVNFFPGWTFHTIPGLKTIKTRAMGNAYLRSPRDRDDVADIPDHPPTGFRPEHMRACMANLTTLDLHNTPFQFTTLGRALAEAKKLKSLSISIDIADLHKEWHLSSANDPHLNTLLPLCADSLEHVNLLLSWAQYTRHSQQFLFGAAGKLTCLPRLAKLKTLRANLRTIFGASRVFPRDFARLGLDYAERDALINAAADVKLPRSLEKLELVEEQDARLLRRMITAGGASTQQIDVDQCAKDMAVQRSTYSEQLKRFALACVEGKICHDWSLREAKMVGWVPIEMELEEGLDRAGVVAAFASVPGLRFGWEWMSESEISYKHTRF
jgi:hypothetical protein